MTPLPKPRAASREQVLEPPSVPQPRAPLVENRAQCRPSFVPWTLPLSCPHTPAVQSLTLSATSLLCLSKCFCDGQGPCFLLPPASGAVALNLPEGVGFLSEIPLLEGPIILVTHWRILWCVVFVGRRPAQSP